MATILFRGLFYFSHLLMHAASAYAAADAASTVTAAAAAVDAAAATEAAAAVEPTSTAEAAADSDPAAVEADRHYLQGAGIRTQDSATDVLQMS